ncbi:MAG: hypothetical protein JSV94_00480 [Methanobacteriota archaeon]|nr:MAG: hypothetical protein JSV94_00480 [Euryarchaeota archaeon]
MNTNQTGVDARGRHAAPCDDRMYAELSKIMRGMSQGRRLPAILTEVVESARRLCPGASVRFKVYPSDFSAELTESQSGDIASLSAICLCEDESDRPPANEDRMISEGSYFSSPERWRESLLPEHESIRWQEGDRFWFPLIDASGNRVADLEIHGMIDGCLLDQDGIDRIRLLVELAAVAMVQAKDLSHYERVSDNMKQRTNLLEDLLTISSSIVSERSPDTLSNMILTSLSTLFGFQRVSIVVFDDSVGEFRWKATFGYPNETAKMALSRTIPSEVILEEFTSSNNISRSAYYVPFEKMSERSRRYFLSPDTLQHAASLGPRKGNDLREGDSLAFVLRDSSARIIGAVYVSMPLDHKIPNKETVETIEIFTSLAEVAMEDARLSAERELALRLSSQRTEQLSRIFDLTSELMYVRDLDHLLDDVLKTLAQLLGLRRMVIGIRNDEREAFAVRAVYGYPEENVEGIKSIEYPIERITHLLNPESYRYADSPVKWRNKLGRMTYYVPTEGAEHLPEDEVYYPDSDLIRHPRKSKAHWHELDYIDTYISDRNGEVIAYIEILRPRDDRVPNAETIEVIEIFASLVGIAIENSRMFQNQVQSRRSAEFFTDLLSHDIKNFNQAIMGYLDMLRANLATPEQTAQIDKIADQVMNVNRMANDVRTMSRLTWGTVNLVRTDLGLILLESIQNVTMYDHTKDVEVAADNVEAERFFVNADELIGEMFSNILTNAVKYDTHDTVRIGVEIDSKSEGNNRWITVSVTDHGCGVPDDMKDEVFARFARGAKRKGSSGLGLHIVRTLARRYKGKVWIEDRVKGSSDKGSMFRIRLPEC